MNLTLNEAWLTIKQESESVANAHQQYAGKLLTDIHDGVSDSLKDDKKKITTLISQGQKLEKELQGAEANLDKSNQKYIKLRKGQEKSLEECTKAKAGQGNPQKAQKKYDSDTKRADKADNEYARSVKDLKAVQDKFYDHEMPKILRDLQSIEEERIHSTQKWLLKYHEIEEILGPVHNEAAQKIKLKITSIDTKSDILLFCEKNKPSNPPPSRVQYIAYNQSSPAPSRVTHNESPKTPKSEAKTPKFEKTKSTATTKADVSVSKKPDSPITRSAGTVSPVIDVNIQMAPNEIPPSPAIFVNKPEETKSPSPGSNSKNVPADILVRCLYDYDATEDNELSFKEGEILVLIDKDETGWWEGRKENGKVGIFPSNFVEIIGAEGKPTTPAIAPQTRCRALYDYNAEDPSELSLKEGEILTIQYEEEGWYFGSNGNGKSGNFPSNYVETLS
eukprot:TRINITY_DN525_c0_g1_i7.p1 TRINITY_DN525_c0_g1~~TRINITY_DN525_c0_g1_i7.p1  ORF type:complete len:448 (-),score=108.04 TRINITY_DN525_c0_g1_i7:57-1400(-)